jgi:hypothetical protein
LDKTEGGGGGGISYTSSNLRSLLRFQMHPV